VNILLVEDYGKDFYKLLNATFSRAHFLQSNTIGEAVALACSRNEPPEIIMIDIDIPDLSVQAMRWIKAALPTSLIIILLNRIDEGIGLIETEASAFIFKHQVIPFLTQLIKNMDNPIQR
jgi:DNA-binding response OmpR family regulator